MQPGPEYVFPVYYYRQILCQRKIIHVEPVFLVEMMALFCDHMITIKVKLEIDMNMDNPDTAIWDVSAGGDGLFRSIFF